jgi:pilus assembly protein CpaB
MRLKPLIMIILAAVFGISAIAAGNSWLKRQAAELRPTAVVQQDQPRTTLVVASSPLRYGDELTPSKLRQVPWPEEAIPPGAFKTVADLLQAGDRRVVLTPIEPNEPVLQAKITGDGQRGTLSALIEEGKGAVTIQVDEVIGLAGFVLPGDRIDVFATQDASTETERGNVFNERILQNVRVLAVGQIADERSDKPSIVRAVTIEVDPSGAQKVALASRSANLSIMLRKSGETASRSTSRMGLSQIGADQSANDGVSIRVTRGVQRTVYAVPRSGSESVDAPPGAMAGATSSPSEVGSIRAKPAARTEASALPSPSFVQP